MKGIPALRLGSLLWLLSGCGDLFSGSRVGTGGSSVEQMAVVVAIRPAEALRFPGVPDTLLGLDTIAASETPPPECWTDSVVTSTWSLDSSLGAWRRGCPTADAFDLFRTGRIDLVLQHPPRRGPLQIALPGTGMGADGEALDSSRTRFSLAKANGSWSVAVRRNQAESSAVWFVDSLAFEDERVLDIGPLLLAPSGCHAHLSTPTTLATDSSGIARCAR